MTKHHYDIAIIGTGITGISAAHHLLRLGSKRLCFFSDPKVPNVTQHSAGFITAGLTDNITRIAHRHGLQTAQEVWEWTSIAFDRFIEFCKKAEIPYSVGDRLRWITSPEELREAQQAHKIFNDLGFECQLVTPHHRNLSQKPHNSYQVILATQYEGKKSGMVDLQHLLSKLTDYCLPIPVYPKALSIENESNGIEITCADGQKYLVEAVILASHLEIATLAPSLAPALVSYADQWHEFTLKENSQRLGFSEGSYFSWNHSHYWGGLMNQNKIRLGGARFMRPLAGFEAREAAILTDIENNIRASWQNLFPLHPLGETSDSRGSLDCWPCDELPIIGPMFGDPRILVGTGYMGLGISMGFYAGCCLAELVQGLRPPLPRLLWPERLRSLPDSP